jgi:transcriptional regulator with XRE-family HTH domain
MGRPGPISLLWQERPKIHGSDFKRWRKSLNLSQKEAAEALGLKRRVVQYYEKGERDGKSIDIPKTVRLACYALAQGTIDYSGPQEGSGRKAKRKGKDRPLAQPKRQKAKVKKHGKEQSSDKVLHKEPKFPTALLGRGTEIRLPATDKTEAKKRPKQA